MRVTGFCKCRAVQVSAEFLEKTEALNPRVCDCDFCVRHGAAYVSDPHGQLEIVAAQFASARQGSGTAEFLLCPQCENLIAVVYKNFAAVNARILNTSFGVPVSVSPKKLGTEEKTKRWQSVWFPSFVISSPP